MYGNVFLLMEYHFKYIKSFAYELYVKFSIIK